MILETEQFVRLKFGNVATVIKDLPYPRGIIFDRCDNILFIPDTINGVVSILTAKGELINLAGSSPGFGNGMNSSAKFRDIYNLAQDSEGSIYIPDFYNEVIRKISFS